MIHICNECQEYCLLNDNAGDLLTVKMKFCPMKGVKVNWNPYKIPEEKKTETDKKIDFNLMIDRLDTIIDLLNEKLD